MIFQVKSVSSNLYLDGSSHGLLNMRREVERRDCFRRLTEFKIFQRTKQVNVRSELSLILRLDLLVQSEVFGCDYWISI